MHALCCYDSAILYLLAALVGEAIAQAQLAYLL